MTAPPIFDPTVYTMRIIANDYPQPGDTMRLLDSTGKLRSYRVVAISADFATLTLRLVPWYRRAWDALSRFTRRALRRKEREIRT